MTRKTRRDDDRYADVHDAEHPFDRYADEAKPRRSPWTIAKNCFYAVTLTAAAVATLWILIGDYTLFTQVIDYAFHGDERSSSDAALFRWPFGGCVAAAFAFTAALIITSRRYTRGRITIDDLPWGAKWCIVMIPLAFVVAGFVCGHYFG